MTALSKNRTFVTLLVAIGLTGLKIMLPLRQSEKQAFKQNSFWSEKRYGKQTFDVLFMGDSRTYKGVSPEILKTYLPGIDIYNFGFSGGRIMKEAEKKLKKNGKRILIFGCTPSDLINVKNEHWFDIKEVTTTSRYFPVLLDCETTHERIGVHRETGFAEAMCLKNEKWYSKTLQSYRKTFSKRPFLPTDFEHFVQNLKRCKKNNIKVIAYRMVACGETDELEDKISGVHWKKIKQSVLDEGFVWIERPSSPLLEQIEERCYDGSHLNSEGARLFSHWLGQELQKIEWLK